MKTLAIVLMVLCAPAWAAAEESPGGTWLGAGVGGGALVGPDEVFSGVTHVSLGWTNQVVYGRLAAGLTLGSDLRQAVGAESSLGVGWVPLPWLEVGVQIGHLIGSSEMADPWADQALLAGVESAQCLLTLSDGLRVCVEESIAGGRWSRRAVEVNDELVFVPRTDDAVLRLHVGVVLRQML
jgi:hypothetical protein